MTAASSTTPTVVDPMKSVALSSAYSSTAVRSLGLLVRTAACLAMGMGAVAQLGWMTGSDLLRTVFHSGHIPMNPSTSICFMLLGGAMWLLRVPPSTAARRLGTALALTAVFITAARLLSIRFDGFPSLDRMLYRSMIGTYRMAPNTATCVLLVGLSLSIIDRPLRGRFWLTQALALVAGLIAMRAAIGYVLAIQPFYQVSAQIPMRLNSAVGLMLLGMSVVAARPDREPAATFVSNSAGGRMARTMVTTAFVIPVVLAWFQLYLQRLEYFDNNFGASLVAITTIIVFNVLIWWNALWLQQIDRSRKIAEINLQQQNMLLNLSIDSERVALKSLQDAQSQLVQSEKMASLGQMVAGIAHEINNPLAFVNNNVAVLNRDAESLGRVVHLYQQGKPILDAHATDLAKEIDELSERVDVDYTVQNLKDLGLRTKEGLRRIQQIIADLRDFARLDDGDVRHTDLTAGIELTLNIIASHAKKSGVELKHELAKMPATFCFPAKINQVVMNLLTNAIDATPEGGTVFLRTISRDDALEIQVSDTGSGIPSEIRDRIFDPFFTTKAVGAGTGLGLSISYGIVKEHGGTITVQSEVGKGSVFTVELPVRKSDCGEAEGRAEIDQGPNPNAQ